MKHQTNTTTVFRTNPHGPEMTDQMRRVIDYLKQKSVTEPNKYFKFQEVSRGSGVFLTNEGFRALVSAIVRFHKVPIVTHPSLGYSYAVHKGMIRKDIERLESRIAQMYQRADALIQTMDAFEGDPL